MRALSPASAVCPEVTSASLSSVASMEAPRATESKRSKTVKRSEEGKVADAALKRFRGFLNYQAGNSKDPKKQEQCKSLLEGYSKACPEERKKMVSAWLTSGGPKANLECILSQTLSNLKSAETGNCRGILTPGQISDLIGVNGKMFPNADEWAKELQKEIDENQQRYPPPDAETPLILQEDWQRRGDLGNTGSKWMPQLG